MLIVLVVIACLNESISFLVQNKEHFILKIKKIYEYLLPPPIIRGGNKIKQFSSSVSSH